MDKKIIARFWQRVDKNGPTQLHCPELGPCWVWTGSVDTHGYGQTTIAKCKTGLAHRVSWRIEHGNNPAQCVLHRCDNRRCVRPDHLFLGSRLDNMQDALSKGRLKSPPQGVNHNRARLNPEKVRQIRRLAAEGIPKTQIAKQFGVWPRAIWMILEGGSWKSVV